MRCRLFNDNFFFNTKFFNIPKAKMTDEKTETLPKIDHMHFGHIHISNQNKNDKSKNSNY